MKFTSPLNAFLHWEANTPKKLFLKQPKGDKTHTWTYAEAGVEIRKIAQGLIDLGVKKGDPVAMLSKNCPHWLMSDLAIQMIGGISIPIYPTLNAESIQYILEHSESKALIIGKLDDYSKQKSGVPNIPVISVEMYDNKEAHTWEQMLEQKQPLATFQEMDPNDLITIIYTSGTTGTPKGVMHSVHSFATVSNNFVEILPLEMHPTLFSYLPLSHVAERCVIENVGLYKGGNFTFPDTLESFAQDLANTQPNVFFAVPRIWAKFQEKILEKMPQEKLDKLLRLPILGSIVKKKIRKKLGLSKAKLVASGAAPLAVSIMEWYDKLGVKINQGYGMTEDCILSHYNLPGANRFGTVGKATNGVTSKLSAEGEILVKSDVLMIGYFKEPEKTKEMFTEDGFLKTGDIGEFDHDGYLSITGRVKDQFKTDKGKYIAPSPIELEYTKNTDIEQICLVGMGIPQPIALIVPSEIGRKKTKDELSASLLKTLRAINPTLESYEKVAKIIIMKEVWSVDNGLLTPTLKIKRNQVEKIHMHMYKEWFEMEGDVIFEN
jgi:long-chain acyl-CoA synthetase